MGSFLQQGLHRPIVIDELLQKLRQWASSNLILMSIISLSTWPPPRHQCSCDLQLKGEAAHVLKAKTENVLWTFVFTVYL